MLSLLGHHVNRRILVSLPNILESPEPLACLLLASEPAGIWVSSRELTKKVFPGALEDTDTPLFVPYTQIAFISGAEAQQASQAVRSPTTHAVSEATAKPVSPRKRR